MKLVSVLSTSTSHPLTYYQPKKVPMQVQLNMSPEAFLVVYEMLYHTQLGDRNNFETAVSEFMIESEDSLEDLAATLAMQYGAPVLGAKFSTEDGMTLTVD